MANKYRFQTRIIKSSTLGVIGLAGMSLPGNGAAGEVNGGKRGRNTAKTSISITTSGLTEPEVVIC